MIKTLVAAVAFTAGLAGYAVAQEVAPAAPGAPMEHSLPPHHPIRHLPPHHPLRNRHAGSRLAHHHRGPAHEFGAQTQTPKPN
jgi:hypothetical protein